jgi:transmembrane sensor
VYYDCTTKMNTEPSYYIDLITRYFSGEADEGEIRELSAWLGESEKNLQIFEEYRKSWLAVEHTVIQTQIDTDAEWALLLPKITKEDRQTTSEGKIIFIDTRSNKQRRLFYKIARVAAVIILLAVSGVVLYNLLSKAEEIKLTAAVEKTENVLPDGSHVTLSPGTTLYYPKAFEKKTRNVKLEGEAYFEVTHNADRPFIISAGENICIEVLGTSFYVNTGNPDGNVEVILTSGKVAVYYAERPDEKTILNPGDKAELAQKQVLIEKSVNDDRNYMAWKTGKIDFSDTRLDKVVGLLNKVYHADIRLSNRELGNCIITATFDNQSLESVLNVLKETLSLTVKPKGEYIEVSGKGCN